MNCRGRKSPENEQNDVESPAGDTNPTKICVALWARARGPDYPSAYADGSFCVALRATELSKPATVSVVLFGLRN